MKRVIAPHAPPEPCLVDIPHTNVALVEALAGMLHETLPERPYRRRVVDLIASVDPREGIPLDVLGEPCFAEVWRHGASLRVHLWTVAEDHAMTIDVGETDTLAEAVLRALVEYGLPSQWPAFGDAGESGT